MIDSSWTPRILPEPGARLDIELLAGVELGQEHVAVAVQPHQRIAVRRLELVHEPPGAAEQHVADALDALERVVEIVGRSDELVLADVQLLAMREVERNALARRVARERDRAPPLRLGDEEVEPGDLALRAARELAQLDLEGRRLPEQHVVLEHDLLLADLDLQLRDELAANVVAHAGERLVPRTRRYLLGHLH